MTSNILSRFLPPTGSPSVYEAIRQGDEASSASDIEERAGMSLDEENLREPLNNYELEDALADAAESQVTTQSTASIDRNQPQGPSKARPARTGSNGSKSIHPKWMQTSPRILEADEGDDDVPASLLVEGHDDDDDSTPPAPPPPHHGLSQEPPIAGPSTRELRDRWQTTRAKQPLHPLPPRMTSTPRRFGGRYLALASVNPREKAMWRWANIENLDNFLKDVYIYFLGNGFWCIMLSRILNLLYAFIASSFFVRVTADVL
jgi:autophagy-related protein 9